MNLFAECPALGKYFFAEGFSVPSVWHTANQLFAKCFCLPSVALGISSVSGSGRRICEKAVVLDQ